MKRRRDRQRQSALAPASFHSCSGSIHGGLRACNHSLPGSLKFTASTTSAPPKSAVTWAHTALTFSAWQTQYRGHGTDTHRHRRLHRLPPAGAPGEWLAPGLTPQRRPRRKICPANARPRHRAAAPPSACQTRQAATPADQHHRLGVGGQGQRLLGPWAIRRTRSSPRASEASCTAWPRQGGRPRHRACRRLASLGPERQMQISSWRFKLLMRRQRKGNRPEQTYLVKLLTPG